MNSNDFDVWQGAVQHLKEKTAEYAELVRKMYKTYPDLRFSVSCTVGLRIFEDDVLKAIIGPKKGCKKLLMSLIEEALQNDKD